jgi:hypothetical protein
MHSLTVCRFIRCCSRYAFVRGDVLEDNPDALTNQVRNLLCTNFCLFVMILLQELLISGHLIQMFTKEKLAEYLAGIESTIRREEAAATRKATAKAVKAAGSTPSAEPVADTSKRKAAVAAPAAVVPPPIDISDGAFFKRVMARQPEVGRKIYYLLSTGNMISSTGLDLMQV